MADQIQTVDYFYVQTPNKSGEACRVLEGLKQEGVNLLAFSGFPSGRRSQLDFIPTDTKAFLQAARKMKLKLSPRKRGFLIQGEDRVGALCEVLDKLAKAKINVTAVDAVGAGSGRYGAILWVQARDQKRAAKALGA